MSLNRTTDGRPARRRLKRHLPGDTKSIKRDVIVIGASAGGVMALSKLFASLPEGLPALIGVVLHRSPIPGELVHVLERRSALPVVEPREASSPQRGIIYLAPPDHHLLFEPNRIVVQRGPTEHSTRPAIDPLFRSAAAHYGKRVVGILLTGCGEDGVSGLIAISQASGVSLTQDPEDAYMPFLPLNAIRFDDISGVFPLRDMAAVVSALVVGKPVPAGTGHSLSRSA